MLKIIQYLVIEVENFSDAQITLLTIADISRLEGKEHKQVLGGNNYLLNPLGEHFNGKNISFVKLNKITKISVGSNDEQRMVTGKKIDNLDLKIIRQKLGIGN